MDDQPRIGPGNRRRIGPINAAIVWVIGRASGGRPPNVFTTLARHRGLFRRWLFFASGLMPGGKLPRADTELVILRVSHNTGCEYEWSHHERIAQKAGFSAEEVERVRSGPEAPGWTPRQRLLLRACDEMHADGAIGDETWAQLAAELDDRGLIDVDGALRTSVKGVYAIGDLVRGPALAHKASDEGVIAVEDAAGMETHGLEYVDIPRATFCTPNVASFGLTEAQAKEAGMDVVVGKVNYGAVGAGTVYGDRTGVIKVVGDRKYGELIGGHIVGAKATELIQELVNVRALEGGYSEVARIVHGHPTLAEGVMEAARAADGWLIHG